jgi:hypothetical protein
MELADQLIENWTPYVTGVAAKLDANGYGAKEAEADLPVVAKLVTKSALSAGFEALDVAAILTDEFSEQKVVGGFRADPAKSGTDRTLTLKGNLKSVTGPEIPVARVKVVPDKLPPQATDFALEVNGDGLKARTYDGYVVATDPAGAVEEIFVSVTIG